MSFRLFRATSRPWLGTLLLTLLWAVATPAQAAPPEYWHGKVIKVENGSTLEVARGDRVERLYLAGAVAPHLAQPWGEQARQFTLEGAQGQVVTVEPQGQDHKKRLTATVILPDGRDLGAELIKEGLAWHHRRTARNPMLADLEKDARGERRGLWGDPHPVPPWEWSGRTAAGEAEGEPPRKGKRKRH